MTYHRVAQLPLRILEDLADARKREPQPPEQTDLVETSHIVAGV